MAVKQILVLFAIVGLAHCASLRVRPSPYGASTPVAVPAATRLSPYSHTKLIETPEEEVVEIEETPVRVTQVSNDYGNTRTKASSVSGYSSGSVVRVAATEVIDDKLAEEQAKSAKYSFASAVDDGIMDQSQVRQEVREGGKVVGSYSYSDGFFKRTTRYEADENGYRVVGEDIEPIGTGPQIDLQNGKADIHTQVGGVDTVYSISAQDIALLNTDSKVLRVKV